MPDGPGLAVITPIVERLHKVNMQIITIAGEGRTMEKQSLLELVRQQLRLVEPPSSGHSTQTVYDGGSQQVLRQTLIVLAAGQSLEEHLDMGEGTVQVLHGQVRLTAGDDFWHGGRARAG